ncbi:hypothetical protein BCR43DRAFT_487372 [Syncephalastrum racemosum]|uniref:RecA family profile 1 domain-containing protein n=1 Tax=Syncephalastrum racemosum TaxID=13706 RepID=A0A1X2HQT0_SYNRA|nr:hypothetical protein BCR43DRAFT_487372 [Syncephalastrum racemosum]
MRIPDREAQVRILAYQLPVLLARRKQIRLVVIDSINATYRGEATSYYERNMEVAEMGLRLKQLAHEHSVAVVAVNQVSDPPDSLTEQQRAEPWLDFELLSNEGRVPLSLFWLSLMKRPALGKVWTNAVTTRLRLARTPLMDRMPTRRALFVEFSPLVPRSGCELAIAESGVRAVL